MTECPCGNNLSYAECCQPLHSGEAKAETAESLMRARYSAYVKKEIDYIVNTVSREERDKYQRKAIEDWAENAEWKGLEIISVEEGEAEDLEGKVEFVAYFAEAGEDKYHHEVAYFIKEDDNWCFVRGEEGRPKTYVREDPKVGRNEPCPCGSNKKYKKCCGS